MEYSRRGYVVLSYDNNGSGDGEARETVENNRANNALVPGLFLTYLQNSPIVDHENIAVAGHSGGCNALTMALPNRTVKAIVMADPAAGFLPDMGEGFETSTLWILGTADKIATLENSLSTAARYFAAFGAEGIDPETPIETGKVYTNASGVTYETALVEGQIHEGAFINKTNHPAPAGFHPGEDAAPNPH